jgi:NitT/TauT family transport system permease protein
MTASAPSQGPRRSIEGLRAAVAPRPVRPIRRPIPTWLRLTLALAPVAVVFVGWWLLTMGPIEERAISYQILPSPGEVFGSLGTLWSKSGLGRSIAQSLYRVFLGFLIAGGLAFLLGVAMGAFSGVRAALEPFSLLGGYLPLPALVPLTLVWFRGMGEQQKVGFLAIACFVYVWPLMLKALDQVEDVYLRNGRCGWPSASAGRT